MSSNPWADAKVQEIFREAAEAIGDALEVHFRAIGAEMEKLKPLVDAMINAASAPTSPPPITGQEEFDRLMFPSLFVDGMMRAPKLEKLLALGMKDDLVVPTARSEGKLPERWREPEGQRLNDRRVDVACKLFIRRCSERGEVLNQSDITRARILFESLLESLQ